MIDIHTHLLPGVDDGSPFIAASLPVLQRFAAGGVEVLVCTPHLRASRAVEAPYNKHAQILGALREAAPPTIELKLGWEIMLDVPGADLRHPQLGLGGSNAILVEFARMEIPPNAAEELFRLKMSGVVPVLAHPERYRECTADQVGAWRKSGAVVQVDGAALLGGHHASSLAHELLSLGYVDVIASDNHGDSRSLMDVRDWLIEVATSEQIELLTRENARRLLAGEPVTQVPPLALRRGMLDRFRRIVLGRRRTGAARSS